MQSEWQKHDRKIALGSLVMWGLILWGWMLSTVAGNS